MNITTRSTAAAAVVLSLALAACGGGDDAATPAPIPIPADLAAPIIKAGGNPELLAEVIPGKVYRTPDGGLYGYCADMIGKVDVVTTGDDGYPTSICSKSEN